LDRKGELIDRRFKTSGFEAAVFLSWLVYLPGSDSFS
jgi:hypothetical protein